MPRRVQPLSRKHSEADAIRNVAAGQEVLRGRWSGQSNSMFTINVNLVGVNVSKL